MNRITEVGIDVSKDSLEIRCAQNTRSIENQAPNIHSLAGELPAGTVVHMEATGGYERLARTILMSYGHVVHVHNPRKTRRLADAMNVSAKTDKIDAKFLQEQGHKLPPTRVKALEHEKLTDISRSIQRLKESIAGHKKYMRQRWLDEQIVSAFRQVVRVMEIQVKELEKAFVKVVRQSSLNDLYELALTVPGVGEGLARVAVSELDQNLERLTGPQACAYAGIAPLDNSSGKRDGIRHIGKGNHRLKAALYMPAVSALRNQSWARELYARLIAKGRCHQQAIIAVMRRILMRVVTVLKRGFPWQENPIQPLTS